MSPPKDKYRWGFIVIDKDMKGTIARLDSMGKPFTHTEIPEAWHLSAHNNLKNIMKIAKQHFTSGLKDDPWIDGIIIGHDSKAVDLKKNVRLFDGLPAQVHFTYSIPLPANPHPLEHIIEKSKQDRDDFEKKIMAKNVPTDEKQTEHPERANEDEVKKAASVIDDMKTRQGKTMKKTLIITSLSVGALFFLFSNSLGRDVGYMNNVIEATGMLKALQSSSLMEIPPFIALHDGWKALKGLAGFPDTTKELINTAKDFFSRWRVNKEDLDEAERKIRGDLLDKWDEKSFTDVTEGISVEDFPEYVNILIKSIGLNDETAASLKNEIMKVKFSKKEKRVMHFSLDVDEFSSTYGFIGFKKDGYGNIDAVYAMHSLFFKLANKNIKETHTDYALGVIPWTTTVTERSEPVKYGTKDINKIRDNYMKHRALESFKELGFLEEINYIESEE